MPEFRATPDTAVLDQARRAIDRANALREAGRVAEAIAAYGRVVRRLGREESGASCPERREVLATAWANQGIAWSLGGGAGAGGSALRCFERSIELREGLGKTGDPWLRYNLAGAWINKGDLLLQGGAHQDVKGAVAAYGRAIEVAADLPIRESALFCRRLALAWLNRGNALLHLGEAPALRRAAEAYAGSIGAAQAGLADVAIQRVAASARVSLAGVCARLGRRREARSAAREALAWTAERERRSAEDAVIGLKGRLVLAAIASQTFAARPGAPADEERVAEAIDAAEEGLEVAARWPEDGRLAPLACELFSLGARAYALVQPQFLAEFLRERLPAFRAAGPAGRARSAADRALETAMGRVTDQLFGALGRASAEPLLAIFRELREAAPCLLGAEG